jgi:hypothetical protein
VHHRRLEPLPGTGGRGLRVALRLPG